MENKISVIIPCYNEEKNITRCIESLLEQDYRNYELIFINDGSKDKTINILNSFKNDKKIKIIDKKKNEGRRQAINDALKIVKDDIIAITDADCIIPKNWLKKINEKFQNKNIDAVGGVYESATNDAMSLAGNLQERVFMDLGIIPNLLPGANSAFKTKVLKEVGGYPERKWGADSFLTMLLIEKKKKIKIDSTIKVKTTYPNTLKKTLRRKYYWGGGLANTTDKIKFRLGFFIRPIYFLLFFLSLLMTIISAFVNQNIFFLFLKGTIALFLLPNIIITILSLFWIISKSEYKYLKALPLLLFLPFIQELSYFIGFINGLRGRVLQNAWR